MKLEHELEIFRHEWGGVNVTAYDDSLVYRVAPKYGKKAAYAANIICKDLGLDLVAEGSALLADDSFCVKAKSKKDEGNNV